MTCGERLHNRRITVHVNSRQTGASTARSTRNVPPPARLRGSQRNPNPDQRIGENHGRNDEQQPRLRRQVIKICLHSMPSTTTTFKRMKYCSTLLFF